jgi:hypothetical protein
MMNWNRFATVGVLVAAASMKAGAPALEVSIGLAAAALLNWQIRPRKQHHV